MDFDEYEYLEKTANKAAAEPGKEEDRVNGVAVKSRDEFRRNSRQRNDDIKDTEDTSHATKCPRSRDGGDRDRHHRSSSHHRSSPSDRKLRDAETSDKDIYRSSRDRDRDMVREGRNGRERDRDRDKERDKERERRREREAELDKERELEHSRRSSMSRSERHHGDHDKDPLRVMDIEMSSEREIVDRDLRGKEQNTRRYKDKREVEPEADPERDQRTVFAYQICLKADERDVYEFFSKAGKVRDVRLIMDRNSRRSKGVGYIEFYDAMSVPMAIALSGQPLLGYPVMVKPSEAEKNLVQSTAIAGPDGSIGPYSGGARRLYVGNLHFNITEDQLRQVFEPFGSVELVQLPLDQDSGRCKGFGFVQFARLEDARAAQSLDGQLDIAGRTIKVSVLSDQVGMQEIGVNAGDFDDDDGGGLSLNARSRAILMQKLDRSGHSSSISGSMASYFFSGSDLPLATSQVLGSTPEIGSLVAPVGHTTLSSFAGLPGSDLAVPTVTASGIDAVGVPSECLLLKNMFDPDSETEPDFELDIREDVQDECTKFGAVKHIYVEKNSSGFVYLRFDNIQSAMKAQRALHGRWFAGKMIEAIYMIPKNYEAKFPDSK